MEDDKNKPKRTTRSKKEALSPIDSSKSVAEAVQMKRKHVYDSLEHCRAAAAMKQQKLNSSNSSKQDDQKSSSGPTEDEDANTLDYIQSLQSKSTSIKSGRFHDTSIDGKPFNLKITTWNINGLRNWLSKRAGLTYIAQDDADIYCFQEIKCGNSKIPAEIKNVPGYHSYWNGAENGRSGVLCFTKKVPNNVTMGIGNNAYDPEARVITLEYDKFIVINVYVPNAGQNLVRYDFRMKWDADFLNYLKDLDSKKPIIVCGDLNVSHHEIDLANPKANLKTAGFTIGERNNFQKVLDNVGLIDVFRFLNPTKAEAYTFWSYMRNSRDKNIGWRLDYFLLPTRWQKKICDCIIRSDVYGSDHCPVTLYLAV